MAVTGVVSNNSYIHNYSGTAYSTADSKKYTRTQNSVNDDNTNKEAVNKAESQNNDDNAKISVAGSLKQSDQTDNNSQTSAIKLQGNENSTKVYEFINKDGDTVSISVTRSTNSKSNLEKMRENTEKIKIKNKKKKLAEKERQLRIREKRIHNREIQDAIARKHKK